MAICDLLIAGLGSYQHFADELVSSLALPLGMSTKTFQDGERYHRIGNVSNADVVLICGTPDDQHTLDLFDTACAITKSGANSLMIVMPYFGYSTMERDVLPGEVIKAKTRARLLSAIPQASKSNKILMVDLHTEGLPNYFEGCVQTHHVYAEDLIVSQIEGMTKDLAPDQFVIGSTDAGRAKWVQSYAKQVGVRSSFCTKFREGEKVWVEAIPQHVQGKTVILYDDMVRSGSSLVKAAEAYRGAGAVDVKAICTHAVLPGNSLARIYHSKALSKLVVSNSHPNHVVTNPSVPHWFYEVFSLTPLLHGSILRYS